MPGQEVPPLLNALILVFLHSRSPPRHRDFPSATHKLQEGENSGKLLKQIQRLPPERVVPPPKTAICLSKSPDYAGSVHKTAQSSNEPPQSSKFAVRCHSRNLPSYHTTKTSLPPRQPSGTPSVSPHLHTISTVRNAPGSYCSMQPWRYQPCETPACTNHKFVKP